VRRTERRIIMSSTLTNQDHPSAATASPTRRARRSVRGVAVAATIATVSAGIVALGTGTATARPPQCNDYMNSARYQWSQASYWIGQYTTDYLIGSWNSLSTDLDHYNSAISGFNSAKALYTKEGC
jgi:hypothetical protein